MNTTQNKAIQGFRKAVEGLRNAGVIRSHRYLGDIAEFLCADAFGVDLATNLRQKGHDGTLGAQRVQVKYHGGASTTVNLGDPSQYDEALVVLGPDSVLRPDIYSDDFLIFRLSADEAENLKSKSGSCHCTAAQLPSKPVRCLSLSDDTDNPQHDS